MRTVPDESCLPHTGAACVLTFPSVFNTVANAVHKVVLRSVQRCPLIRWIKQRAGLGCRLVIKKGNHGNNPKNCGVWRILWNFIKTWFRCEDHEPDSIFLKSFLASRLPTYNSKRRLRSRFQTVMNEREVFGF